MVGNGGKVNVPSLRCLGSEHSPGWSVWVPIGGTTCAVGVRGDDGGDEGIYCNFL